MFDISHFIITLKLFYKQLFIISMLVHVFMTFQNTKPIYYKQLIRNLLK